MSIKLQTLRNLMQDHKYDFYFIPSADNHNNEYVPECWQYRAWISNFTGSAGDVLVGQEKSFLSTDGRYFLQARKQLESDFDLLEQHSQIISEIEKYLLKNAQGKTLALDPKTVNINRANKLKEIMHSIGGRVVFDNNNLIEQTQIKLEENSPLPQKEIFIQGIEYSGQSLKSKIENIRHELNQKSLTHLVESRLDNLAWALNIRGSDLKCTPAVIAYLIISLEKIELYVDSAKITTEVAEYFAANDVEIKDYNKFYLELENATGKYLIDGGNANYKILECLNRKENVLEISTSPIILSKSLKNRVEILGAKDAHKKDAVAYIHWWHWLENNFEGHDEISSQQKLLEFRKEQNGFSELSFATISGFGSNGAIIHYSSQEHTNKKLEDNNLYLVDSGGQYLDGTTDITRVFHLGKPSFEQAKHYTLVLKGHLAVAKAIFPKGTKGIELDTFARQYLWRSSLDYNHGTGHGVGSFLSVHEGPQVISKGATKQDLLPGMIVSNEPGLYLEGQYGIRIENLHFIKEYSRESITNNGPFYTLESLTLVPYELKLINLKMLSYSEKKTINNYHLKIRKIILPLIDSPKVRKFLIHKTRQIKL